MSKRWNWRVSELAVERIQKRFSWVPMEKARAQLSRNQEHVLLIGLDGTLFSLKAEFLLDLIAGHRESMRIFKLEEHRE
jgi:hypothetical protein